MGFFLGASASPVGHGLADIARYVSDTYAEPPFVDFNGVL
jgi:hypothetical protein